MLIPFENARPIDDRTRLIALTTTRSIGRVLLQRLLDRFGSLEVIFAASAADLRTVHGIGPQIAAAIRTTDLDAVAADLERFQEQQIMVALWQEATYPARLLSLPDSPLTVYYKGAFLPTDDRAVAIVGTREGSPAALKLTQTWADGLARRGWTIVSGLARGIDAAGHRGALTAGGRTIAVLGSGINQIYPPEHQILAAQVVLRGALLSEIHPDSQPMPNALMRRNRLIVALSRAVIIVQAGETSGALHAARAATDLSVPLFVVNNSAGNAALLANGQAQLLPADLDDFMSRIV